MTLTLEQKKALIADAALQYLPPLPDDPDARARQDAQAWKVATVLAAGDGMDADGFRTCLEAIGFLPYESVGKVDMWGMRRKTAGSEEGT